MNTQGELLRRDRLFDFMIPRQIDDLNLTRGTVLYMEDVSVAFDGFKAIDNLNFYIDAGELRCLIGPNGAGKTTMMDIITGRTRPDTGTCWFGGRMNLLRMTEAQIARAGVGRKFQTPTVFENHTVYDNLELAVEGPRGVWDSLLAKTSAALEQELDQALEITGLTEQRDRLAGNLSHGQKQWLEIGMLLVQRPQLLLIDEPAAGMTHQEIDRTIELLLSLAGHYSLLVVEHDMEFVRALQSRVTVLHQGSVLAEGSMQHVQQDSKVIEVYLGSSEFNSTSAV